MRSEQDRPWERLDRGLAADLEPALPALADEVIAEIGKAVPEYRRPLEGTFGRGLRIGVRRSLKQFVDLIGRPGEVSAASREIYKELGRGELRSGRSLDALQAAYRLGTRISWRRLSSLARQRGATAETVSLLAESIFAYIDEVAASSVEGYAEAQADVAGERERRRRRLVRLLVEEGDVAGEEVLRAAAIDAAWELPLSVSVLLCTLPDAPRLATMLGAGAIGARMEDLTCVLIPEAVSTGMRAQVSRALARAQGANGAAGGGGAGGGGAEARPGAHIAALGPAVPPAQARSSFARAKQAMSLQAAGVLGDGLVVADEHLLALVLHRDRSLMRELARRRLAPLEGLSEGSRARLEVTLLAWLRDRGGVSEVAAQLHVHRQTVRYRLGRLRELLGDDIDDPDARLELDLALRWLEAERRRK